MSVRSSLRRLSVVALLALVSAPALAETVTLRFVQTNDIDRMEEAKGRFEPMPASVLTDLAQTVPMGLNGLAARTIFRLGLQLTGREQGALPVVTAPRSMRSPCPRPWRPTSWPSSPERAVLPN